MEAFRIRRDLSPGQYRFGEIAEGVETAAALVDHFGDGGTLTRFLETARVEVENRDGFMWIDPEKGCLMISRRYLERADRVDLYLDLVHEVVHLRQLAEGRELFDRTYTYDERPTEVEAYAVTIAEGRRLGLSEESLWEYLRVPWISESQHANLCRAVGVEPTKPSSATA